MININLSASVRNLLLVFLCFMSHNAMANSKRIALVIGNSAYQDSPLKNPVNDASDMADKLAAMGFEVEKLLDADQRKMKQAISRFGKKLYRENTIGLFYFAGHGIQVKGHNYLLPIGTDIRSEADVEFEAVNADRILSQMSEADNGLNMVILDACRNNPFARSFRSSSRGLARMSAPRGSLILYATSPGNVAADGSNRNGLFTEKLMRAMDKKGLKIEEVFKETAIAVSQASDKQQIPYIEGVILGDFYFTGKLNVQVVKPDTENVAGKDSVENRFWDSVQKAGTKEMYEAYLAEYPNGHYQRLADIQLQQLAGKTTASTTPNKSGTSLNDAFKTPETITDPVIAMELIRVPSGCFMMGSPETQKGRESDELQHQVCITRDFYLGKYELTQGQWKAIMGTNPSVFKKGDNHPVESLKDNNELQLFLKNIHEKTGHRYRLPTEAEWEYACRSGGKEQTYCGGEELSELAWYGESWKAGHHPVGKKKPNGLGLYDMSGNVREWVLDMYDEHYYKNSPVNDPQGPTTSINRVTRGGTWNVGENFQRASDRFWIWPIFGPGTLGLRLARDI